MRIMGALTDAERLEQRIKDLTEMRERIDAEIRRAKAARRKPGRKRPRPECGTERGYQRHYREGEVCARCKAAHRAHERERYARAKLREAS